MLVTVIGAFFMIKDLKVDLIPNIRKAEIHARRAMLSETIEGSWVTSFKGRGIEFAGYRQYQYGDDASIIDWRASLRSKDTLVRQFEEYKTFSVFIMLDVSDSMLFSSTGKLKCEYGAELAYALADGILNGGDAVGLGMFNDKFISRLQPDIGRGVLERMKQELLKPENYGGKFDFKRVMRQASAFLGQRVVVVIISDFIGMEDGWQKYLAMMSERFEMMGIILRDPRDRKLPMNTGQYTLKDPYTSETLFIDVNQYAKAYEEHVKEEEASIGRMFKGVQGASLSLSTDEDYLVPLTKFLRKRRFIS